MIKVSSIDFLKLIKLIEKEGQQGAPLTFQTNGSKLEVRTFDRSNKSMLIELSDINYPYLPTVTKTEAF